MNKYSITNSFYIWGAGTDIGKTVFASSIIYKLIQTNVSVHYIKPVDTGGLELDAFKFFKKKNKEKFKSTTFFKFASSVSPHRIKGKGDNLDQFIISKLKKILSKKNDEFIFIEGAGGVASPSLDGNLQCAIYAPIKLPIVFVADFRLGGISNTLASVEFVRSYGFEIICILCFEGEHENAEFLKTHYGNRYPIFCFPNILNNESLSSYWKKAENVTNHVNSILVNYNENKIEQIKSDTKIILNHIWWPFTQHKNIKTTSFIDSAHGQNFSIASIDNKKNNLILCDKMDASQSWWTQNLGHGNALLAQEMAFAAGRYGHVMFPKYLYSPVARLVKTCLGFLNNDWAERIFLSDNGSTAIEVAIKMAFRLKFGLKKPIKSIKIFGLKNSYHGDTLAALDATSPSVFKNKEYWYHGERGTWISYPEVYLKNKKIYIRFDSEIETNFLTFDELFNFDERKNSFLEKKYRVFLDGVFATISQDICIGACLFEGIVQAACGMIFVDPLFLRLLVLKSQKNKIPVIIDDIFSGVWRLGFSSTANALKVKPDIACFGKGITGGVLPIGITMASEKVYKSFLSDSLEDALFHSHSYNGNPISTSVVSKALELLQTTPYFNHKTNTLNMIWSREKLDILSQLSKIQRCYALGTLLVLEVFSKTQGYLSKDLNKTVERLKNKHNFEIRPLGSVLYIISSFEVKEDFTREVLDILIDEFK